MRYASVDAPFEVSIRDGELRAPGPDEIGVRAVLSGVSVGTEVAVYRGTIPTLRNSRWGYWTEFPIRPGYELVGTVESRGSEITDVTEGDRVVCHTPHATAATVNYEDYVRVPPGVSNEAAGMAMLGATTAHGIRAAGLRYGDRVLILGFGVVGLLSAEHARRGGARQVYVADPREWKRELAAARGFQAQFDPTSTTFAAELLEATGGLGADVIIEASGQAAAVTAALPTVRRGGRILLQGTQTQPVPIDFGDYPMHREITFISVWGKGPARQLGAGDETWSRKQHQELAMELISRGELRVSDLITHRYPFDEIAAAYADIDRGDMDFLHVVLDY